MFKEKNKMKAKMKRLTLISMPVFALALLVILGTALAAGRDPVSGSGNVTYFAGPATLTIGDETFEGNVVVTPTAPPEFRPSGVIYFPAVQHVFSFGDQNENTFTTIGKEVAVPIGTSGAYILSGYMTITEGTGVFADASGEMSVQGEITDLNAGKASFEVHGAISR